MKKIALVCSGLLCTSLAHASALYFYEIGTEDTALAGAGQAARAQDASTIATNPAGMTRLPDHMFTGGLQALGGNIDYQLDNSRQSPGNILDVMPNGNAFYSQKLTDNLYAGIGMYGNFGLGIDYGDWAGDGLIKKSSMMALTVSPSLAYKLSDKVSIGASVNANYGFLSLTRDVDGDDKKQKDHDWAASYRLGLLMQLTDQTRAGITWNSKTDYDFDVDGKVRLPQGNFELPLTAQVRAPQQIMLSVVHDINKQWSVMGDLGWQDWSQFGAPQITVEGREVNKNSRLKDTWHTALGVQYRPTEEWRLNAGVAFDSTPYHSQGDMSLSMPTGDEWRFGTGAQYQITPASNIGFAMEYMHMQSGKVASPDVFSGHIDNPYFWFASVNYSYQF
ncbi:outer membrane protein transport protein [Scandinavium sp. V105_16]|uniref:Outer membrane protein transport protein n=1 Tax=Scandinavium lactucae TaxID=3095028 RepID=A0AAJ2VQV8_9ENTR|nr:MULTISPECIES: outer membrane protein transport protein [unclassified Scandinavium]MDX6018789.1 outer membrane protein transport protein [Scandinavium sp. V105_16]MDX6030250.1 outer membrane protein transport protein [Scandinavium sp. V105_12]